MSKKLCDQAPVVDVKLTNVSRQITMIYPYYENPKFLFHQLCYWSANFSNAAKNNLTLILVDDGSPNHPAELVLRTFLKQGTVGFPIRLFRIDVDVRWNWLAARNIAAHHATTDWIMMTDMDHKIPPETMNKVILGELHHNMIYRFSRRESTGEKINPHPNSWLMTAAMFWRIGGYDEALSGHYGTDSDMRRRCGDTAPIVIMRDELERNEYIQDSSTTKYLRKQPEDKRAKEMIRARTKDWKPKVLTFPYHEVAL